jgi:CRP-like cAMP-binding protein
VGLLAPFGAEELAALERRLRRRRYDKGTVLFVEGDPGTSLYVIESGRVKIVLTSPDGRELIIAWRGPGEFFGDMALLDGGPRSADAIVDEDCRLALLQREDFQRFLEERPAVAIRLLAVLSQRLRDAMQQQLDAIRQDAGARVASALLRMAQDLRAGATGPGPPVVQVPTQTEFARFVGLTRESVNKWLGYFERSGVIRRERGKITILRPEELRKRLL